jgi:serine/threonine protein kinase
VTFSLHLGDDEMSVGAVIGTGATGVVHEARLPDGRVVAVKILHAQLCGSSQAVSRYAREVTALSTLQHPNSVRFLGHGETDDGRVYIVMERLVGEPLSDLVRREAPLTLERVLPRFLELCEAVAEAHATGIVHRDIKPENIFVVREGGESRFKLIDFGFVGFQEAAFSDEHSALTTFGSILGTPGFMSPEQARGLPADERSDVYSLAVTLYECLSGKIPFDGETPMQVMVAQTSKPPIPLEKRAGNVAFPKALVEAIDRAMRANPQERTASAAEFVDELRMLLPELPPVPSSMFVMTDVGPRVQKTTPQATTSPARSSHALLWAVLVPTFLLLGVGLYFLVS